MPLNSSHIEAGSPKSRPHEFVNSATALQRLALDQTFERVSLRNPEILGRPILVASCSYNSDFQIRDDAWQLHCFAAGLSRQSEIFDTNYVMQSVEAMFDLTESIQRTLHASQAMIQQHTHTGESRLTAEISRLQAEHGRLRTLLLAHRQCCGFSKVCTHSTHPPSNKEITEGETPSISAFADDAPGI